MESRYRRKLPGSEEFIIGLIVLKRGSIVKTNYCGAAVKTHDYSGLQRWSSCPFPAWLIFHRIAMHERSNDAALEDQHGVELPDRVLAVGGDNQSAVLFPGEGMQELYDLSG